MKIRVYQINPDRDEHRVMFLSHDRLERFQGNPEVNSSIYDKVYDKDVPCGNLEEVYTMLNSNHPSDYRGRSLSVSDIVEVYEAEAVPQGFYFCDSVGFRQVAFHPEECGVSERMNEQSVEKLSVLLVEQGKYPQMIEMEDSLEAMQRIVGGDIEEFMPYVDEVAIICNEEGKLMGLPLNRALFDDDGHIYDIVSGNFLIVGLGEENFTDLSPDLMEKYGEQFKYPEKFARLAGEIIAVKQPATNEHREKPMMHHSGPDL